MAVIQYESDVSVRGRVLIDGGLPHQFLKADGSLDSNTYALASSVHNPVTIGTANGLSLATQQLSLGLASSSTTGALSGTDWNTFNGKLNTPTGLTTNFLPKWNGSGFGNSSIFDNGTNIGIGTTNPTLSKLQTKGNDGSLIGYFYNKTGTPGQVYGVLIEAGTNTYDFALLVNSSQGSPYFKVNGNGNSLFGTIQDNLVDRVQVAGTISASPATTANQVVVMSQINGKANADGSNVSGTWGINISGNASSATNWGGRTANLDVIDNNVGHLLQRGNDGVTRLAEASGVRTWLGLGSNAYTSTPYLPLIGGTLTGNLVVASTATASLNLGSVSSSWAGSIIYPTIFGSTPDRWVMHINPHISYTSPGVNGFTGSMLGATIRFASNPDASAYWDAGVGTNGVGEDRFSIGRSGTNFLNITNSGTVQVSNIFDVMGASYLYGGLTVSGSPSARTGYLAVASAIAIGDSDTGFRQNGDGFLEYFANNVRTAQMSSNGWVFDQIISGNISGNARAINIGTSASISDLNLSVSDHAVRFDTFDAQAANKPISVNNANGVISFLMNHGPQYGKQIAFADNDDLYIRKLSGGTYGNWLSLIHSGNIGQQTVLNSDMVDGRHVDVAGLAGTIPVRNASGYLEPNNWIQFNGAYGLYNPTNGAHFTQNDYNYGSWKVLGAKNGWKGMHFGEADGITLMMNSDEFGFYKQALGSWVGRFTHNLGWFDLRGTADRARRANGNFYIDDNYGNGIVGVYSAERYQGVYSMGDAYKPTADGTSLANHYGIAWTHINAGGQSKAGLGHQMLITTAGVTQTAIGTGIWSIGKCTLASTSEGAGYWTDFVRNGRTALSALNSGAGYGLFYYQATAGRDGSDSIDMAFGTTTSATSAFSFKINGEFKASTNVQAPALYDSGRRVAVSRPEGQNYIDYSRYVYNNGAYSGTGWVEPSDLGVRYANSAGSAPNANNQNSSYLVTPGDGNGIKFWASDNYKISMGGSSLYQYGPVTDYSIKMQMNADSPRRGFTWGREGIAPIAALNATSGNFQTTGNMTASAFSQVSDMRLKIVMPHQHISVENIAPITYLWKDPKKRDSPQVGYSAQEVQKVMPYAVSVADDGMLSVNYIQVLVAKVAELELKLKKHGLE